ncbi:hypothetical protein [Psychrobacter sp. 72-O-c]|uniref:hypothetical protein n=1 Tax=Psychrobacter sp. 72-O-c TaxID=2774125 RepID=UPI001918E55A|nr:hypothetical protein [Psychrobacter sp. 72-O-c]
MSVNNITINNHVPSTHPYYTSQPHSNDDAMTATCSHINSAKAVLELMMDKYENDRKLPSELAALMAHLDSAYDLVQFLPK